MSEKQKSKLIHGLSDFHIAVLQKDSSSRVLYGEIAPVEGAISVSGTPNADQNIKYADNGPFAVLDSFDSFDVDMAAVDIPEDLQTDMYGEKVVNGVVFSNKDDIKKEIALGFKAQIRGGGHRFYWLLKGTPEVMGIEHETDAGSVESKDANLKIKFIPLLYNGEWRSKLSSAVVKSEDWFESVVYDDVTAKALPGGSGGGGVEG